MKYDNDLNSYMTIVDIKNYDWSSYIEKTGQWFILSLENQFEQTAPDQILEENQAENLATFCRGYLLAWEYAQQQEEQSC